MIKSEPVNLITYKELRQIAMYEYLYSDLSFKIQTFESFHRVTNNMLYYSPSYLLDESHVHNDFVEEKIKKILEHITFKNAFIIITTQNKLPESFLKNYLVDHESLKEPFLKTKFIMADIPNISTLVESDKTIMAIRKENKFAQRERFEDLSFCFRDLNSEDVKFLNKLDLCSKIDISEVNNEVEKVFDKGGVTVWYKVSIVILFRWIDFSEVQK